MPRATVVIDGDLSEWQLDAKGIRIDPSRAGADAAISLHQSDPGNPFKGPADLSARAALAWNDECLFIAADVTDDDLRGIKPHTAHNVGPPGWGCDSVMFRVHSFRQPLKTNNPHSPTPFLALRYVVHEAGRGALLDNSRRVLDKATRYWKLPKGSRLASRETPNGYQVEASVPWSALEFRPQAGELLFGAFLLADIDAGEKLNQLGWRFSGEPRDMAVLRLVDRPEATAMLSLAADSVRAGDPWSVGFRVDARTMDVEVLGLECVGGAGRVIDLPINLRVPKGQTATDVLPVAKAPDKPGKYRVTLNVRVGQETLALAAESVEVIPGPPPAPLIRNQPGELHRQRPDRVAHSAFEDCRRGVVRHGFVKGRADYERYILTHVKSYVDSQMEPALKRNDKYIAGKVLMAYTLYKLTGQAQYGDWVRRGLEVAIANQKRELDAYGFHLFILTEVRYHVWLHEPKTPLAPPGIERDFQTLWARVAAEHDPGWMFAEWGYHNRCWHRAVMMRIARHFARKLGMPIDPRVDEYLAWHLPVMARFGAATDNSSGYYWVGLRYPVYWHMATDTLAELGRHEGWVAALNRWRRYSSPSGAVPNFGDTSGWCTGVGQAMANYELMGGLTRDGRFRWQAHRIAEYLYNHFWPRHNQYHLPREFVATGFCRAWLIADDTVKPVAPDSKSAITFRTRCVQVTKEEEAQRAGLRGYKLVDEQVPDKLILSSGNNPNALWGLVELVDHGGHCGQLPGHVITLVVNDSALLVGPAYNEESCDLNNILWLEDMEGLAADPRPMRTEVTRFVEDRAMTYARIRVRRFQQMPVTYERDLVFVKNGFLLVKDRVTFHAMMKVRVGPCWQTRDLGPQCGKQWLNTYYDYIYFTGLGLGRGVHAYRNPAWDLLVRFAPRRDTRISVADRYDDNPWRPSPTRLRQSWAGIAKPGDVLTFTSLLLPHAPAFDVTPFAHWAVFLVDNDDATLVRVRTELDNIHHFQEVHWLLLQEEPKLVQADGFASDAMLALASVNRRGKVRPGAMVDGSVISLKGQDLSKQTRKAAFQSVFEVKD